jgi:signal transduction histidine kinase
MLRSGDWLVPRLDGLPFFHKPPLFYWIGAAAMAVTGPVEWAARLPSVLGAGAAASALFLFLRRWSTVRVALLSTVVLVTTPFFFLGAQFANLDMLVAGCIACTVLLAAGAVLARERAEPWRALLAGAYLFAAAGLLAKGLIGLVLPAMVIVPVVRGDAQARPLRLLLWLPGWAVLAGRGRPVVRGHAAEVPRVLRLLRRHAALSALRVLGLQQRTRLLVLPAGAGRPHAAVVRLGAGAARQRRRGAAHGCPTSTGSCGSGSP